MYFALVILVVIGIWLVTFSLDHSRIRSYLETQDSTVLSINWRPFGRGWFGEKDSRIYLVRYKQADGSVREAHCKTGLFSGVYFTDDVLVNRPASAGRYAESHEEDPVPHPQRQSPMERRLLEENHRLRAENESLREENRRLRADSGR